MDRHAGFAIVASLSGGLIDQVAAAYATGLGGPIFFPAPDSITTPAGTVDFAGIFQMLAPHIELHPNPGDLVTVHFKFRSSLRARLAGLFNVWRRNDVEVSGSVQLRLITNIVGTQVVLGIDTSTVTFAPLSAKRLSGPAIPPAVMNALQSPQLAALASAFVQSRPNIMIAPPALQASINKVFPGEFKDSGISIFEWFRIYITASRIVARPMEGAITIAVDFAGYTSGDPNLLVDLTRTHGGGHVWVQSMTPAVAEQQTPQSPPYLFLHGFPAGGSVAVLVNMNFISAILNNISGQIANTRVHPNAELLSIWGGYSTFTKPLYPGQRDGLKLGFRAKTHPGGVLATGAVYIQPYVTVYDGPTNFLQKPWWRVRIEHSELDVPWYVEVAVVAVSIVFAIALPFLTPIFLIAAIAILDGVLPGLLDNARSNAANSLQKGIGGLALPDPGPKALPGLPGGHYGGDIHHICISPEGLDMATNISAWLDNTSSAINAPAAWHAEYKTPIPVSVKLSNQLEAIAANLSVTWQVFSQAGALLGTITKPYRMVASPLGVSVTAGSGFHVPRGVESDPDTNGILIGRRQMALYYLAGFKVRCTVTATLGSQVGEVWTSEVDIPVDDNLDRTHKFVKWGPKRVYFSNAGTNYEGWVHDRTSRIHRTATAARCIMLRQRASDTPRKRPRFQYFDALPYGWTQLYQNRHYLCEFCFFGGPDKTSPYPSDDWF